MEDAASQKRRADLLRDIHELKQEIEAKEVTNEDLRKKLAEMTLLLEVRGVVRGGRPC